ncbi:MAG: hypothetical protein CBC38_07970 [Gammaproteobacteria bacterium TMED78]|nr:MAG: hypothetical protein CBC38_07970 [Gammaproteobacteria bacterium TMED78]
MEKVKNHRSFIFLLCLFPFFAASQTPDIVLYNAKILTIDEDFSIHEAVAIDDNKILSVGENEAIQSLSSSETLMIDLEGKTVIPGIIDSHLHYLRGTNFASHETRIHGITSKREALSIIADKAQELNPGEWIFIFGGWHEQQFSDNPGGFTQEDLDRASPENPVFIQKTYSAFYMNSLALEKIAPAVPHLYKGGSVIRTTSPQGREVMYAALKYYPFATSDEGREREVKDFNNYLNSMGITTAYDVGYLDGSYKSVSALADREELTLRIFYAQRYWADSPRTAVAAAELLEREAPFKRDHFFGEYGIGEHVYGLLHDNPRMSEPFSQSIYDSFELIALSAAKHGWQLNEHAMLESTVDGMLDVFERINLAEPISSLRWTIGHNDLISMAAINRAKSMGLALTVHNHTVKPKVDGIASPPIKLIQDSGILWGMGSDGTVVATYNPFHTIWEYTAGKVFPDIQKYNKDEVITREEALIAHTRSNAYLMFMEDLIGTIEPNKYADIVVLDKDYMDIPIDEIYTIKPVLTIFSGKIVYQDELSF